MPRIARNNETTDITTACITTTVPETMAPTNNGGDDGGDDDGGGGDDDGDQGEGVDADRSALPRRPKVLPYVPNSMSTLFQGVVRPILQDIENAGRTENDAALYELIKELLGVPA